ncbi:MAG TPA: hypothetical protein VFH31_07120 [Pyrinomonadaceae bacterium]|nr:hypothetical protein [Pyrinomonadaceae bacterium]
MKSLNPIARAKKYHRIWLAIGLFVFVVNGCSGGRQASNQTNTQSGNPSQSEGSTSGAKPTGIIKQVHMAKDNGKGGPGEETDTFGPTDNTIHCVVELAEPNAGAKIRYSWWVVEAQGEKNEKVQNQKIEDFEYTTKSDERIVHGHLTMPDDWPPGKYKVDVYVNGNLEQSVEYNVS